MTATRTIRSSPKRAKTFFARLKRSIAKRLPLLTGGHPS